MIEFAVRVAGLDAEDSTNAHWVLAVDSVGERLLIVHDDHSLHWYPLADCTFAKAQTPDQPRLVLAVQPKAALATPTIDLGRRNGP